VLTIRGGLVSNPISAVRRTIPVGVVKNGYVGTFIRLFLGVSIWSAACSSDNPTTVSSGPTAVPVTFHYVSAVPVNLPAPSDPDYTGCVHHYSAFGGSFVLEGSWAPNARYPHLDCAPACSVLVPEVPVGEEHVVFMRDLSLCKLHPSAPPISYENLSANRVTLSRIVDHRTGVRGLAFTVTRDGTVHP
jgi:hypothetical protein